MFERDHTPIYKRIRALILEEIDTKYRPGDKIYSQNELCRMFHTSHQTVRRALDELVAEGYLIRHQGKGTFVAPREDRLAYAATANRIGLIMPVRDREFDTEVIAAIAHHAAENRCHLIFKQSADDAALEFQRMRELYKEGVKKVIVLPVTPEEPSETLDWAVARGMHVVCIDRQVAGSPVDAVVGEDEEAAYELTRHLIEHGRTRIATTLSEAEKNYTFTMRYRGYTKALQDAGLEPYFLSYVKHDDLDDLSGLQLKQWLARVMTGPEPPDALVLARDRDAIPVYQYCRQHGISIPEKLAVTGFGNFSYASVVEPALTSVDQNPDELAKSAIHLILERAKRGSNSDTDPGPTIVRNSYRIILRHSCGCTAMPEEEAVLPFSG